MLEHERILKIKSILEKEQSVNVEELSKRFDVSSMTIRRDLQKITSTDDRVKRCHGGAVLLRDIKTEAEFSEKLFKNTDGKIRIAAKALELIHDNDVIYLDAGTTTYELAKKIADSSLNVTMITNDLEIARAMPEDRITVMLVGGVVQKRTWCMLGNIAEGILKNIKPDIAFMGCTAVDEDFNVLTPTVEKTALKPIVVKNSVKSYMLVDQNKFYKHSPYIIYSLNEFGGVITDKKFSSGELAHIAKLDINIITI